MKKILSMFVLCALLLTVLGIFASAATFYDYGTPAADTRITVRKSNAVKIDGVISAGEYEEYTGGYTEWYVAENASDHFADAEEMAKSAKWYFSWDGKYLNFAAQYNAGPGANQTFAAGDYYGDYAFSGTEDFIFADDFLSYGPGVNVVSGEQSLTNEFFGRLFVAISENTATGGKLTGMYSDQNGQNQDYFPPHSDFDFTYSGTWVTVEYRIPIIELCETFKENQGNQMFKASIVLQAGIAGQYEIADDVNVAVYAWGVRLGQLGYACDASNTEKGHATFRLLDEPVKGDVVITPPTTGGNDDEQTIVPPTTGGNDEEDTIVPPTTGGNDEDTIVPPTTGGNDEDTIVPPTNGGNDKDETIAPPTGDIMVVAAVVSAISACGVMIAKKRK